MLKNTILVTGQPMTGKTTREQRLWTKDHKKGYFDLSITFWNMLHQNGQQHTIPFLSSVHGRTPALSLSFDVHDWANELTQFHSQHPKVNHIFLDECQCIKPVLLTALIYCIRDFYPTQMIYINCIDFDSWHHKLINISQMEQLAQHVYHLKHTCMIDGKNFASRRLHLHHSGHTWTAFYDENKYNNKLRNNSFRRHCSMISVCPDHYYLNQTKLNDLMKHRNQIHARVAVQKIK